MPGRIEHVVIIVKENHTFDNYFGSFRSANGQKLPPAANPPPDDPDHRHEAWVARDADHPHRVQYGETDLPGYFEYARRYTLCDNYFSEVAGPSTPNHLMLICADAPIGDRAPERLQPRSSAPKPDRRRSRVAEQAKGSKPGEEAIEPLRLAQFYVTPAIDKYLRAVRAEALTQDVDVTASAVARMALQRLADETTPQELVRQLGEPKKGKSRGRPRR